MLRLCRCRCRSVRRVCRRLQIRVELVDPSGDVADSGEGGEPMLSLSSPEQPAAGTWRLRVHNSSDTSLPVGINTYSFSSHDDGTRAVYEAVYASVEALQQVLDMGMVEGATGAINQIDAFLAEG